MLRSLAVALTLTAVLASAAETAFAQPAEGGSKSASQPMAGAVTEPAPVYLLPDATRTPLRTLPSGTVVTVGEIREDWVQITFNDGILGSRTGWIERRFLTIRERAETPPAVTMPPAPPSQAPRQVRTPRPRQSPSVRGLIGAAFDKQAASESFAAVTGEDTAVSYGAGVQGVNLWRGVFAEAFVEWTQLDGERVFVSGDEVFQLGIPLEIEMRPIDVVGGWRETIGRVSTYGGGGVSWLAYKETSDLADPDENVDERYTGWIVLGGVEVALARWVHARGEVRYRRFDDALGAGGASAAFEETRLGGTGVLLKFVVGR
jgi:opacity protein-like surface antigen